MYRALMVILACAAVSGCGIKPGSVEPPEDSETKAYPRTYPDLATDPPLAKIRRP